MHLVCPGCQYHSNDLRTLECPRCGAELEDPLALRLTRPAAKVRRQFKPRRDPKRNRRREWTDIETRGL